MGSIDGGSTGDGFLNGGERFSRSRGDSGSTTASKRSARRSAALASAVVSTLLSASASAQQLEEIIVTAQKREQDIQRVPIAVSAFTTETLRAKGVTDINALTNLTPNVNLDSSSPFSGDTSVLSASIRGIGQDDFAFNLDPGVGVYLDGVFLARTFGANQNLMDVDRVEILKGPQGTLFGRNTIGGAINIVTHVPGPEPSFEAQATVGEYNRTDLGFTADLPITDSLLSSLTVSSMDRDGYQDVIPYPADSPWGSRPFVVDPMNAYPRAGYDTSEANGGINQTVVRGKLLWLASDAVEVTLAADWQHQDQPSTAATVLSVNPNTDPNASAIFGLIYNLCISTPKDVLDSGAAFPFLPFSAQMHTGEGGLCGPRATGVPELGGTGGAALGGAGYVGGPDGGQALSATPRIFWDFAATDTGDIDKTYANGVSFAKNDGWGISLTADWELGEELTLKSITGYREIDWKVGIDLDGTPESIQEVTDHQKQEQWSQEFQLLGTAFDDRLNYVFGLYYFTEEGFVHDFVPFEGLLYVFDYQNDVDTESYAPFLHTDFAVTDKFTVILGGRYTWEDKSFIGGQADLNGFTYKISGCNPPEDPAFQHLDPSIPPFLTCQQILGFPVPGQPLRYFPADEQKQDFSVFTPTVGVQYQFTDDVMAYAKWSKGFKSGGWTTRLSAPILDGADAEYKPEFAETSEIGLKTQLLDNHLLVNTAIFYTDYKDIQLNFQEQASPVLRNGGTATLQGIEVEAQAVFVGGLGFTFAGGYIDAEYDEINPLVGIPLSSEIPKTPEYKVNVGPTYDFNLANGGGVRLAVDYTYTAEMFNDSLNTPDLKRPSVENINAVIRYTSPGGKYEFAVGGTNLSDERYLVTGSINEAAGEHVGTYSRPREWYATVRVSLD
jgi:iron complex outermembrane recepter protein